MKESSEQLLQKASRAIEAANTLLDNGLSEFSTGRAYYAMFYTAEALLNEKGLRFRKHGGVHSAFGEHFIKANLSMQNTIDGYSMRLIDASKVTMVPKYLLLMRIRLN